MNSAPIAYQLRLNKGSYTLITFDKDTKPTDRGVVQGAGELSAAIDSLRFRMLAQEWPAGSLELRKVGGGTTDLGTVEPLGQLTGITF